MSGATTFWITTLDLTACGKMAPSIAVLDAEYVYAECHNNIRHLVLSVFLPNAIRPSAILVIVVMPSVSKMTLSLMAFSKKTFSIGAFDDECCYVKCDKLFSIMTLRLMAFNRKTYTAL